MSYRDSRDSGGRRDRSRERQPPARDNNYYGEGRRQDNNDNYRRDDRGYGNNNGGQQQHGGQNRDSYRNDRPREDFRGNDRPRDNRDNNNFRNGNNRGSGPPRTKKPHMGEIESVQRLVRSNPAFSDAACLKIIDPPMMEKFRDDFLDQDNASNAEHKFWLPKLTPWRASQSVGLELDNKTHIVRANYFRVNPEKLPPTIYQYNVTIWRYDKDSQLLENDLTKEQDKNENTGIIKYLTESESMWQKDRYGNKIGIAYDGRSTMYATAELATTSAEHYQKDVAYPKGSKKHFSIIVSLVGKIMSPRSNRDWKQIRDNSGDMFDQVEEARALAPLQALDVALLAFARWQLDEAAPTWVIAGNKAFRSDGTTYEFGPAYLGRLGYAANLKVCLSGLLLVADVSVSCFLRGGKLTELMSAIAGYRSVDDLYHQTSSNDRFGLPGSILHKVREVLKGCKIRLLHLGHSKKLKDFGVASSHPDSSFEDDKGQRITVAEYYALQAIHREEYRRFLCPGGTLRYPRFPTVEVGSKKKSILIPLELVEIIPGQSRRDNLPSDITSQIIKYAAMAPQDRFANLSANSANSSANSATSSASHGLFQALSGDVTAQAFGLDTISSQPMKVQATILPPPKLQYGNHRVIEPELRGSWNLAGNVTFAHPPPPPLTDASMSGNVSSMSANVSNMSGNMSGNVSRPGHMSGNMSGNVSTNVSRLDYPYGILVTYRSSPPNNVHNLVNEFVTKIEHESRVLGIPLVSIDQFRTVPGHRDTLGEELGRCQRRGARIVFVLLYEDVYPVVKLAADTICLPTQCIRWQNLSRPPRGYHTSILVKVNMKMGGVNHTLASRLPQPSIQSVQSQPHNMEEDSEECFQFPPKSLSWVFDDPCMVMGIDVNHPEGKGTGGQSVAAVVASMDGSLGQYCCHVSTCGSSHEEPVASLEAATHALLTAFSHRNGGKIPRRIIIYRDGLADNQFKQILEKELGSIKEALSMRGISSEYTQIAVIMCQKRHSARFVYQNTGNTGNGSGTSGNGNGNGGYGNTGNGGYGNTGNSGYGNSGNGNTGYGNGGNGNTGNSNGNTGNGIPVDYANPCVGLCVDGRSFTGTGTGGETNLSGDLSGDDVGCVNTPQMNEFYINSHAAVLGTSKPCKYTLIYDEIGFKLAEIELLSFWTTHLYGRCTRSVSYATPAYYAHWAARRGKVLLNAGARSDELLHISESWLQGDKLPSLYFV